MHTCLHTYIDSVRRTYAYYEITWGFRIRGQSRESMQSAQRRDVDGGYYEIEWSPKLSTCQLRSTLKHVLATDYPHITSGGSPHVRNTHICRNTHTHTHTRTSLFCWGNARTSKNGEWQEGLRGHAQSARWAPDCRPELRIGANCTARCGESDGDDEDIGCCPNMSTPLSAIIEGHSTVNKPCCLFARFLEKANKNTVCARLEKG